MKRLSEARKRHGFSPRLLAGALGAFVWQATLAAQAADLGRIMPMGDSITLGVPVAGGYRDPLYTLLNSRGDTFTLVGSLTDYATATLSAAGQTHHEGHSGYVIAAGGGRSGLDENLAGWIGPGAESPDRILLMIGSNDINLGYDMANAPARLSTLITHICGYRPGVRLYVASIVPMSGHEPDVQAFNAAIPGIVASHRALGQDVVYVPMYEALNISTDLADGLHPNALGYQHMAQAWDTALHTSGTHAVDVTGAGDGPQFGARFSVGWDFTVSQTITVTSLGQFDPDSNPQSNTVAIYQRGGAKLVEAAVPAASPAELSGIYSARYVSVSSTVLPSGDYVVLSTQNGDNFVAPGGSPTATFGSAITWNKGVALGDGSAAGPLPATAPASWPIENTTPCRYFGPTFAYEVPPAPPALTVAVASPASNQAFTVGASISATATVANATGAYTVRIYTNSGAGPFAEAGAGGSASPYGVALGTLPAGTYHIYATVADTVETNRSATNTFTVAEAPTGVHAIDLTSVGDFGYNNTFSVGWDFTVSQTITVTSLGQFDPHGNPPQDNTVVIYQRGGAKLVEATVLATSPSEQSGNYPARYVPVSSTVLTPGSYVAFSTQHTVKLVSPGGNPTATLGIGITWNKGVALNFGSAAGPLPATAPASWPIENNTPYRYFGPTFKYTLGVPPVPPLPPTLVAGGFTLDAETGIPALTFHTQEDYRYRVLYTEDLSLPLESWSGVIDAPNYPAPDGWGPLSSAGTETIHDPGAAGRSARFYRMQAR